MVGRDTGREPPGFQRTPQLRIIVVCAIAALVLAVVVIILDFRLGNSLPSTDQQPDDSGAVVVHPVPGVGVALTDPLRIRAAHDPALNPAKGHR